ncbi:MAG: protein of unknown function DUF347 [Ktedonobacterales bacterium]|jgi:uncharacterized membrane-anchored protein|nr:MAG: protein of unknown function DUF347 [Ktedonobacterales bacterium]
MGRTIPNRQLNVGFSARGTTAQTLDRALNVARKVPEITIFFWIAKLLSTALGESTSDYLVYQINPYLAVVLGGIGLAIALILQFRVRRYIAWVYWLAVVMVAIFGTMAADVVHIVLLSPLLGPTVAYLVSTIFFAACLVVIFAIWYLTEKTLSIHSINTPRREVFYWATVMATFALGTAAGDMTAYTLRLGFFTSGLLFTALFALPALAYGLLRLNALVAFWLAYIVTRPLGASFADWMGKPKSVHGLNFGDGLVSLVLTILIVGVVGYLTLTRKDVQADRSHSHS